MFRGTEVKALFAGLSSADFGLNARGFAAQEQARLYALASMVWDAVHYSEPRNETQIALDLLEMQQIVNRKNKARRG
jgi:hypothetical protein